MVSVYIEVGNETGSLKVAVRARSIQRAVRIVVEQYLGNSVRVEFPIDPEIFFADDATHEGLISTVRGPEWRAA